MSDIVREAAEAAYSEMAFTLHDIVNASRRKNDDEWSLRRGKSLAEAADRLRVALDAEDKGLKGDG